MNLPKNYKYYYVSNNIIRSKFQNCNEVEKWIADLEKCSKSTWRITKTFMKTEFKKCVFKRIYHCFFKTRRDKIKLEPKKKHTSRNTNCPAQLKILIKRQIQYKSKHAVPDHLITEWPCIITFKNQHNHTVDSVTALMKRPIGEETKQKILNLFDEGHSVASAYNIFCLTQMEELGDENDSYFGDRHYFPKKSDFSNLWAFHFKIKHENKLMEKLEIQEKMLNVSCERTLCHY